MKIVQIASEINSGSVGRIAEQIGGVIIQNSWKSYITYARIKNNSISNAILIGSKWDIYNHALQTRIFDNHAFGSKSATKKLICKLKLIKPDIIHLHHLHGYYINIEILFNYLREYNIPIVWTFHDCWSFTGHCAYFDFVGCEKWKTECYDCEQKNEYPKSLFLDRSRQNFVDKKNIFKSVKNMTIVPVSNWLGDKVKKSFLASYPCIVIQNGIDLDVFYPRESRDLVDQIYRVKDKIIILGVASTWDRRKGLDEFIKLNELIDNDKYAVILVGLSEHQIKTLPKNIIGINRTENVDQLADLYSAADLFLNPTFEDTYPTTNLEALACGTPVITYNTGGSIESVNNDTGIIVGKGDLSGLIVAINEIKSKGKKHYSYNCREYALKNFDKKNKFNQYIKLYNEILKK
jgi:glycosyltransferase involved in cell wall biosynthesis